MKIKVKRLAYDDVCRIPKPQHRQPRKSDYPLRAAMKLLGGADLRDTDFSCEFIGMDGWPKEPSLLLMNHSSFIDLEIAANILFPAPFAIVCTSDGFVGKEWLMRHLGCIPTNKFVSDPTLLSDISYALKKNKTHVLMYPEASYTFDGRATPLPRGMSSFLKLLDVPVLMIKTEGAFLRDPRYNMLQKRKTKVSATVRTLFSREDLKAKSRQEINDELDEAFTFDNFGRQSASGVEITESFRADGLHRILYKCPCCGEVGKTVGHGITLECKSCGALFTLDTHGNLLASDGTKYGMTVPEWYDWERKTVREEILNGTYKTEFDAEIFVLRDYRAVYDIGQGHLVHTSDGFDLRSADGSLHYTQPPQASYSLYADYYWYEIGDMVCIVNNDMLYYCFPNESDGIPVARARLAAEEMYKLYRKRPSRIRGND